MNNGETEKEDEVHIESKHERFKAKKYLQSFMSS